MGYDRDERTLELLRAAKNLLQENEMAEEYTVFYDGAQCDGACLLADIENHLIELGEENEE